MNCKPNIICSTNNDHLHVRTQNCWCYLFTVSYKYKCPTNGKCIFTILCFSAFYTDHLFQGQTDALQGKCHQSMLCRLLNIFHHYIDFFQKCQTKRRMGDQIWHGLLFDCETRVFTWTTEMHTEWCRNWLFLRLDKSTNFDFHILKTCRRWMGISGQDERGLQIRGFKRKLEIWGVEAQRAHKTDCGEHNSQTLLQPLHSRMKILVLEQSAAEPSIKTSSCIPVPVISHTSDMGPTGTSSSTYHRQDN